VKTNQINRSQTVFSLSPNFVYIDSRIMNFLIYQRNAFLETFRIASTGETKGFGLCLYLTDRWNTTAICKFIVPIDTSNSAEYLFSFYSLFFST